MVHGTLFVSSDVCKQKHTKNSTTQPGTYVGTYY